MSLAIRMSRGGSKKRPFYNIVVADSRSPRDGRYIERLGFFNPMVAKDADDRLKINAERAKHWLSVGAQPSDRVSRFLASMSLIAPRAVPAQTKKSLPKAKALERIRLKEEAVQKAIEAKEKAAAEAKAALEAPQSEPEAAAE